MVMERPIGALVNAGPNLPVGFRFTPTDGELIVHYLRRKVFNLPLPSHFVPECDFYDKHPRDLPGNEEEKHRYFFCRKKQRNGVHGCRYWTPIGEDRIVDPVSNRTIGFRRTLVLNETMSCPNGTKFMWIMHEFCLPATIGMRKTGEGEWAVYHVFRKKIKPNRNNGRNKLNLNQTEGMSAMPDCIDLRVQESSDFDPPPPPMSP